MTADNIKKDCLFSPDDNYDQRGRSRSCSPRRTCSKSHSRSRSRSRCRYYSVLRSCSRSLSHQRSASPRRHELRASLPIEYPATPLYTGESWKSEEKSKSLKERMEVVGCEDADHDLKGDLVQTKPEKNTLEGVGALSSQIVPTQPKNQPQPPVFLNQPLYFPGNQFQFQNQQAMTVMHQAAMANAYFQQQVFNHGHKGQARWK